MLATKIHHSPKLQAAYDKYGADVFEWQIVEYIDAKDTLIEREQFWLDFFNPSYNVAPYAERPNLGRKMSDETRQRMSATHKKRPGRKWSEEEKVAHSIRMTGKKYGKRPYKRIMSAETRAKIAETIKVRNAAGYSESNIIRHKRSVAAKLTWARRKGLSA